MSFEVLLEVLRHCAAASDRSSTHFYNIIWWKPLAHRKTLRPVLSRLCAWKPSFKGIWRAAEAHVQGWPVAGSVPSRRELVRWHGWCKARSPALGSDEIRIIEALRSFDWLIIYFPVRKLCTWAFQRRVERLSPLVKVKILKSHALNAPAFT